ncbi:MAG TPA: YciI family protein [Acidimicrobiales bacterium]|nr:YciI family protein [Acidimicrobiales bacterium]
MAQYLLSVWHDDPDAVYAGLSQDEMQPMFEAVSTFNEKITANGHWVFGGGLENPNIATVVRPTDTGDVVVTDGPYSEVKEGFGGFWIINAADLDEALALAKEASLACRGPVEVRPFQDEPTAE